jgi:hypothetical protein
MKSFCGAEFPQDTVNLFNASSRSHFTARYLDRSSKSEERDFDLSCYMYSHKKSPIFGLDLFQNLLTILEIYDSPIQSCWIFITRPMILIKFFLISGVNLLNDKNGILDQ